MATGHIHHVRKPYAHPKELHVCKFAGWDVNTFAELRIALNIRRAREPECEIVLFRPFIRNLLLAFQAFTSFLEYKVYNKLKK